MKVSDIPLPDAWPRLVRTAMLHVASLARWNMIYIHSNSECHEHPDVRSASAIQQRDDKIALLNEHIRILQTRIAKIHPKNRPFYPPAERMSILVLKAAQGWNLKQTANAFGVTEETISNWMRELEQEGPNALVQIPVPVNKYPEFLTYITQQFKTLLPLFGKKTLAEYFLRAGLHASSSSIGRRLKACFSKPPNPFPDPTVPPRTNPETTVKRIVSRHSNHIWLIDLTAVPLSSGFWTSWQPFSLIQKWPFCWWVLVIVDHFSRRCIGFALFKKTPSSKQVQRVLNKAIRRNKKPKYIISDKGTQFWPSRAKSISEARNHSYHVWCQRKGIAPRFGAVGKHGSIAITERFIRSLKTECTRRIIVPFDFNAMRIEVALYIIWYNQFRPHSSLHSRTPQEVYDNSPPLPVLYVKSNSLTPPLELNVSYLEGRRHLPVVELKLAA